MSKIESLISRIKSLISKIESIFGIGKWKHQHKKDYFNIELKKGNFLYFYFQEWVTHASCAPILLPEKVILKDI